MVKKLLQFVATVLAVIVVSGLHLPDGGETTHWAYPRLFDGTTLQATYLPTIVKSIQSGTIDLNNVTSNTATITSVSTGNALLFYNGFSLSASSLNPLIYPRISLTNSTTVTAQNEVAVNISEPVTYTVVEFFPGTWKSIQRNTIDINGSTSATQTISSVNAAKSFITSLGFTYNLPGNNDFGFYPKLTLTNATTVTASTGEPPSFDVVIGFQVVEGK